MRIGTLVPLPCFRSRLSIHHLASCFLSLYHSLSLPSPSPLVLLLGQARAESSCKAVPWSSIQTAKPKFHRSASGSLLVTRRGMTRRRRAEERKCILPAIRRNCSLRTAISVLSHHIQLHKLANIELPNSLSCRFP